MLGWLLVWQLASWAIGNGIILAGPIDVVCSLINDVVTPSFWQSIGFSFLRIVIGGLAAFFAGVVLALCAHRVSLVQEILEPAVAFLKAVPVVCIIVILLLWVGSSWTSVFVVIMVVFPGVYYAIGEALQNIDVNLSNMMKVFKVRGLKKFLFFYWPSVLPFILAASKVLVGMSWKAGVAAELIGIPAGSIGEGLYLAKISLATADLFSWTVVIVVLSLLCEKVLLFLLIKSKVWAQRAALRIQGAAYPEEFERGSADAGAHELSISYEQNAQKTVILRDFSYQFRSGGMYCLMAPSGYGKTSLLMTLMGLKKSNTGTIYGFDHVSAVFQEDRLFETCSAIENCRVVASNKISGADIEELLSQLISKDKIDVPVSELSGGMRRRVELARALLAPSEVLILDEPFSGLDDETRNRTVQVLHDNQAGRIVIVATHNEDDLHVLGATSLRLKG